MLFIIVGPPVLIRSVGLSTTVPDYSGFAPGGVHNLGLMHQQLVGVAAGLGCMLFGAALIAIDRIQPRA
jgi:hypothetical protein